jgi:hypothetical protein
MAQPMRVANPIMLLLGPSHFATVLRIRICRIHMLGLLDPDPSVRGTDPAPAPDLSIIKQKE